MLQAVGRLEGGFEGEIVIDGEHCERLDSGDRTRVRREKLGFVYQFHHLLPDFTAAENVLLPQLVRDTDPADAALRAKQLLAGLGLGHRRSEAHTSELQSLMRNSYAVFCFTKKRLTYSCKDW